MRSLLVVGVLVVAAIAVALLSARAPGGPAVTDTGGSVAASPALPTAASGSGAPAAAPTERTSALAVDEAIAATARVVHVVDAVGNDVGSAGVKFTIGTEVVDRFTDANGRVAAPPLPLRDVVVGARGQATCRLSGAELVGSADLVVRLPPAAELRVEVVDDHGRLVLGQLVEAVVEDPVTPPNRSLLERHSARTDDRGCAVFEALGAAQYWVIVHGWRRWSGTDHYGVKPLVDQPTLLRVQVIAKPAGECVDVVVRGIDAASWNGAAPHPSLCIEIEHRSGLERIHPPGEATVIGDAGRAVRVRVVSVGGNDERTALTGWQRATLGQPRAIEFQLPAASTR